jgi:GrpB-like predicted nucleotidyltransferase (UPF0157 family)
VNRRDVVVVDYDPEWPSRAQSLIDEVIAALGGTARRIEHIGSTAVPGMAAKDVLDVQVSVDDLDAAAGAFADPLRALGFERLPYNRDHVPAGCSDPADLWAKRFWHRRDHPARDANLHVRLVGSPNERLALLFRDWFRAHPTAIAPYASFKRTLASALDDSGIYSDVKDPVVDLVITVAETWAAHRSWTS